MLQLATLAVASVIALASCSTMYNGPVDSYNQIDRWQHQEYLCADGSVSSHCPGSRYAHRVK